MEVKPKNKKQLKFSTKASAVRKRKQGYICMTFRFADAAHHQLVKDAAAAAGLQINPWLIQATLAAARPELKS